MHTLVPDVLEDEGVPTRPEGTPDAPSRSLLMEWREVLNDGNARNEIEGPILELQMRDVPDLEVDAGDRIPVVVDGILGDVDADDVHPMIAKSTRPASGTASDIERPAAGDRSASVERCRECTTLGAIDVAVEPARRSRVTDDLGIGNAPALPVEVLPVDLQFLLAPHGPGPAAHGLFAHYRFSMSRSPRAMRSIFVRVKVSTTSSGVQQVGSFVFRSTGTAVRTLNAWIRS